MASKKRNVIVGQSGGPTAVINSSLAGVYKTAKERGFHKVYGMLHGIEGLLDEMYELAWYDIQLYPCSLEGKRLVKPWYDTKESGDGKC